MGAIHSSSIDMALTGPEKGRIHKLFQMMDYDKSGTIECDEICTVHDSDKDNMIRMLDTNGDNVVDKAEWTAYMESKKAEKVTHWRRRPLLLILYPARARPS